jgi:hypothetical protein
VGHGSQWFWFEIEWEKCLDKKNKQLRAQGRKELSRFHAADSSSYVKEFEGWTGDERSEFTGWLINVIRRFPLVVSSYTLDIQDLVAEFPEARKKPNGLAHILLLNHIMTYLGAKILGDHRWPSDRLELIHDRGAYNPVLKEAFDHMKNDTTLQHRERFATIAPMGWEDCIRLQVADLLAYENFKCVERESAGHKRRKSLELILDLDSFGGRGVKLQKAGIREIREKLSEESKRILFENARIGPGRKT